MSGKGAFELGKQWAAPGGAGWKGIFVIRCHDFDASIFGDSTSRVDEFAVEFTSQGFLARIADRLGNLKVVHELEFTNSAIWEMS